MTTTHSGTVRVADTETREAIFALEARRHRALMSVDINALSAMFDDALIHIHAPGLMHTKDQLLEHVQKRQAYLGMRREKLYVRLVGDDVAIMTGRLINRLSSPDGTERTVAGAVSQVLRRGPDGAWRFLNFQMTPDGEHVWPAFDSELDDGDTGHTIDTTAHTGDENP